jgi:low affinity Fe/Cu permease
MVFLIQNSHNRDTEALQVKLDELINALRGTNELLLDLERLDEKELDKIRETYLITQPVPVAKGEGCGRAQRRAIRAAKVATI